MRGFDPRTKEQSNTGQKEWLWRRDKVMTCPCGKHSFARTQEFVSGHSIRKAKEGVILKDQDGTAMLHQMPWLSVYDEDGNNLIPEELQRTEEIAAHFAACHDTNRETTPYEAASDADMAALARSGKPIVAGLQKLEIA